MAFLVFSLMRAIALVGIRVLPPSKFLVAPFSRMGGETHGLRPVKTVLLRTFAIQI